QAVEPASHPHCERCGKPQPLPTARCAACRADPHSPLLLSRGAALHTSPLREAIHALKYEQQPELAAPLARYLVAVFAAPPWDKLAASIDAVTPAPLHPDRLAERGYNQSELLAQAFCAQVGLRCEPGWLARTRATRQQVGLNPAERWANVAGAFAASPAVAGQTLLLIDDVYTPGATLRACAAAARAAGARAVYGLALAIPPRAH
ncbi:MAG TPA: ComF family protein, partial [Caldilineaceae bacterium]|nr:ComF family protein [Caldilineaceae bacterium]